MFQEFKNYYHLLQAVVANIFYGFPSRKLKVIGVTGTDGKTTTTNLIYHILRSAGHNVSMVSTVGASIGGKMHDIGFHVTTPSPFAIQKYIKKAVEAGSKYLVLETTSHALDQNRVWGIDFEVGVLTNVTHEHLDYHKTYDRYLGAKMKLLRSSKVVVVNRDDSSFEQISLKFKVQSSKLQLKSKKLTSYGLSRNADINPIIFPFKTKLFGRFNQVNSLAAIAACRSLGVSDDTIRKGVETFEPPIGRQQIVFPSTSSGQVDFKVMVDFAHTPNAFEVLLPEVRKVTKSRLIHVFGAAGERDFTKRPKMGEVSSRFADIIILTAEDPRNEDIEEIMEQISSKIFNFKFEIFNQFSIKQLDKNKKYLFKIPDRKEAIEVAIKLAQKGDFVVITGKGHEKSMNYGRGEEDWDEFEAVKLELKKRG